MRAIAAYMASRRSEENGRRNEGGGRRNETYGDESRMEYGGRRYENMPTDTEMRRRRDKKGRFMEYEGAGNDGGEYEPDEREDARSYNARNEYTPQRDEYGRVENWYKPTRPVAPSGRRGGLYDGGGIGFGTRDREYETRNHYENETEGQRKKVQAGGTFWMEPEGRGEDNARMDQETAEEWVRSMRNEDSSRPTGGKWTAEELKPMAKKLGIEPEGEEFYEFYAMTNAMYSDYCAVAKKYNITSPEFYGLMAKAWMEDKDGMPNKTAMYYECCVRKGA